MRVINYDAQTKEVTEIEVPDEEIPTIEEVVQEPTLEERVTVTETKVVTIEETIDVLFGGI